MYRKLAIGLILAVLGGALVTAGYAGWAGWALMLLGGGYALMVLRMLGEDTERVVIDDAGVRDSALPVGTIGWDDVRGASVQEIGSVRVVQLEVRDPERFIRRLPAGRQFIARKALEAALPALYLTLAGTVADPGVIADAITRRVRRVADA